MRRIGVDEAGKGPVLGAMIAAAVHADPTTVPDAVADSKTIDPPTREALATTLQHDDAVDIGIAYIPVTAIDDPATDMNTLTVEAHAAAIRALPTDYRNDHALLDAGEVDADRFADRVANHLPTPPGLQAEHEADATDPLVAAASIVAKVTRDAHITAIGSNYDTAIGSGYPSDPTTREFVHEYTTAHGHLPPCARTSWQTSQDILANTAQSGLDEY